MRTPEPPCPCSLSIRNVRENVVGIDTEVPLLDGSYRTYIHFDNAASTPVLRPVFDRVNEFMDWYSSVHRGAGFKSQVASQAYEKAHEIVCDFVGADPGTHTVILGKNTTEALNKLARRYPLEAGDVVISSLMEHHSNDLPWRAVAQVERVLVDGQGALDEAHLDSLLDKHAGRVRLVAITGASNVTGIINPIHRIAEKTHAIGAEILVDAAQLAPHRAVDMRAGDDPGRLDFVVLSAHKMYAPYGTGALIGPRETFLQGDPEMVGGGTVEAVTLDHVRWAGLPDKEEAGSPNVVGGIALAQAMLNLKQIGMAAVAEHEARLTTYLLQQMTRIKGIQLFGPTDPARAAERTASVPFAVPGMSHYLVAAILSAEGGIGVRSGCFCAHPYLLHMLAVDPESAVKYQDEIRRGIRSNLPGLVRVSLGCYSNESEIDHFVTLLERVVRREYQGVYVQDPGSGAFRPEGFNPDLESFFKLE